MYKWGGQEPLNVWYNAPMEYRTTIATETLKTRTHERDVYYVGQLREIIKEFSACPQCRNGYFCYPKVCISSTELARTLTTLGINTRRGKLVWSTHQATLELNKFKIRSRQFTSQQKKEDSEWEESQTEIEANRLIKRRVQGYISGYVKRCDILMKNIANGSI